MCAALCYDGPASKCRTFIMPASLLVPRLGLSRIRVALKPRPRRCTYYMRISGGIHVCAETPQRVFEGGMRWDGCSLISAVIPFNYFARENE